jgi:lysophospholipase L1-like esterase
VFILAIGAIVGFAFARWNYSMPTYAEQKTVFVRTAASIAPPMDTVALGDSVTEEAWLEGACGKTFNAGIGGARVIDLRMIAKDILPRLRPKTIVVAVGANHFWKRPEPEFQRDYPKLIAELPQAKLILVGVPNSAEASAFVRNLARQNGATYLPPVTGAGNTVPDGVHLTTKGAWLFRARIERSCRLS